MKMNNISRDRLLDGINKMNSYGTRLTGSKGHNDFIRWLKKEIGEMDIPVFSDPFYFTRWEEKRSAVEIIDEAAIIPVSVASAYPYSGQTPKEGIIEELVYVKSIADIPKTAGKIAVFSIRNINFLSTRDTVQNYTTMLCVNLDPLPYTGRVF